MHHTGIYKVVFGNISQHQHLSLTIKYSSILNSECGCPPLVFDDDGTEITKPDGQKNLPPQKCRRRQETDGDTRGRLRSNTREPSPIKRSRIPTTLGGKKHDDVRKQETCCSNGKWLIDEDRLTVRKVKSGSSITLTHRRLRSSSSVSRLSRQPTETEVNKPNAHRSALSKSSKLEDEQKYKVVCKRPVCIPEPKELKEASEKKEDTKPDTATRILKNSISKTDATEQTEAKAIQNTPCEKLNVKCEDVNKSQTQEQERKETRGKTTFFL